MNDIANAEKLIQDGLEVKKNPMQNKTLGQHKVLGLIFFNTSLRTRLSTQKAAYNLGLSVVVMNIGTEGWALETEDGAIMNGQSIEHIKDAAAVVGLYCDIIAVRCFPTLISKKDDYSEKLLLQFMKYSKVPVISLESATLHPLQSLADMMTIYEHKKTSKPKVVLTWSHHIKALPQAVPNSFSEWALKTNCEFTITHPLGYELCEDFTNGANIEYNQDKALSNADFVYVKNWSAFNDYGNVLKVNDNWLLDNKKMKLTNNAKIMHCLPVRRNVELNDELADSDNSLILAQAENRIYAAQTVLKQMLETQFK